MKTPAGVRDKFWQRRFVEAVGCLPQPAFAAVDGICIAECCAAWRAFTSADLTDLLLRMPGAYILKPRFGSNGVGVARVVSHPDGRLTVESDCPDTDHYLDEFPHDPELRGRDLVVAGATHRARFVDGAAGLPERTLNLSVLEGEIRQDRADGSVFEPRVVVQRVGSGERFAVLGVICKRIDTPVGACVARDFREESLETSLARFLANRVPGGDVASADARTRDELLSAAEGLLAALVPLVEASAARIHQFGIDYRLCWDEVNGRAEFPFLEFQFGIGRIDWPALGCDPLAGYKTPAELRRLFGPETG